MKCGTRAIYYEHGSDEVQAVQALLRRRHTTSRGCEYLVQWAARDARPTWEPEVNITEDLVIAFQTGHAEWRTGKNIGGLCDSSYPDACISARSSKRDANELFKTAIQSLQLSDGRVLYLDGLTGNTSRTLQDCIRYVKVPINTNGDVFHALTKLHLPNTSPFYGLLRDAIRCNDSKIAAFWFDYCCTFSGNSWCHPRSDFGFLLQTGHVQIGSIFAFTFSLRDRRISRRSYKTTQSRRIIVSLRSVAYSHGIRLTCVVHKVYWPSILFLLFKVKSIK